MSLLLVLMVVVPSSVCVTIPWTKVVGFLVGIWSFYQLFIFALLQPEFGLSKRKGYEHLKVSYAVLLAFALGTMGYIITVAAFFMSRSFSRKVYQGQLN